MRLLYVNRYKNKLEKWVEVEHIVYVNDHLLFILFRNTENGLIWE
jgi:hypothetical protein